MVESGLYPPLILSRRRGTGRAHLCQPRCGGFFALSEHLNNLVQAFSLPVGGTYPTTYTENLDDSISGLSSSLIHSTVLNYHVPMEAMHSADKLEVVRILESQGVFATKGSVGQVARELHISEPTVYRYLQKIRNGKV